MPEFNHAEANRALQDLKHSRLEAARVLQVLCRQHDGSYAILADTYREQRGRDALATAGRMPALRF